jgi:hypothetical protein
MRRKKIFFIMSTRNHIIYEQSHNEELQSNEYDFTVPVRIKFNQKNICEGEKNSRGNSISQGERVSR